MLTILIDAFYCVNQSLDVDCLLPAILVDERDSKRPQARNGRKIVVWPDFDSSTLERLVGIRLANYTVGGVAGFVGQFRVAQAAGVSSAIRLTGKSPKPDRTERR